MVAVGRLCLGASLLALCVVGCDRSQPVGPALQAASIGSAGPTVKAPSNTNAIAVSPDRIDVSWRDNATNETGFELHRSTSGPGGTFTKLASTGANVTAYSDAGLKPLTQYCYKVRAFRTYDGKTSYSDFSNTASATTPTPPVPTAPSATNAVPSNSSTVDVTWTDNSANEDGFRVERSLDGGGSWATVSTTVANVTSLQDGGRSSEQQACYRVIAFNASGDSPASNTDCTVPPAAPNGLEAMGGDGPAIDLAWTDNSAVEDGYEVRRSTDGVNFGFVADLAANSSTYHDAAVSSNTTYSYRVRAKKDGGFSDFSNIASAQGTCSPVLEECQNYIDDDCDGLVDGFDPDCPCVVCEDSYSCAGGYICAAPSPIYGCCLPHCFDGAVDGDESDVDCGGFTCPNGCAAGQHCYGPGDCASSVCINHVCQ